VGQQPPALRSDDSPPHRAGLGEVLAVELSEQGFLSAPGDRGLVGPVPAGRVGDAEAAKNPSDTLTVPSESGRNRPEAEALLGQFCQLLQLGFGWSQGVFLGCSSARSPRRSTLRGQSNSAPPPNSHR
jgi:hypothetical protein